MLLLMVPSVFSDVCSCFLKAHSHKRIVLFKLIIGFYFAIVNISVIVWTLVMETIRKYTFILGCTLLWFDEYSLASY